MEYNKTSKLFWVYILLTIQALGILVLLPFIAVDVWLPSSSIDIIIILGLNFLISVLILLPLWKYRKEFLYSFALSVITSLLFLQSVIHLFLVSNPHVIDISGLLWH